MRKYRCLPVIAMLLVPLCSLAQQTPAAMDPARCTAAVNAIEQDMQSARARGQMLRRQQLATELARVRAQCEPDAAQQDPATRIAQLEQEIRELRTQLARAEAQLRALRAGAP